MLRWLRGLLVMTVVVAAAAFAVVGSGYLLYTKPWNYPLRPVDAIVVLGGENDGRVPYGLSLARQGFAQNLVISNPHGTRDPSTNEGCATRDPRFTVTCVAPNPSTTRGEAQFTRDLAELNGWTSILVISWRYHLPRAQYIFGRCFDGDIIVRPVPREYHFSLKKWAYTYTYQTGGFVKAALQGSC